MQQNTIWKLVLSTFQKLGLPFSASSAELFKGSKKKKSLQASMMCDTINRNVSQFYAKRLLCAVWLIRAAGRLNLPHDWCTVCLFQMCKVTRNAMQRIMAVKQCAMQCNGFCICTVWLQQRRLNLPYDWCTDCCCLEGEGGGAGTKQALDCN